MHINKIYYDNAANITQTQLMRNLQRRLTVNLHNRFFQIFASAELTAVDVNNCHGLGVIDNKITAARQCHLSVTDAGNCFSLLVIFKDILQALIQRYPDILCLRHLGQQLFYTVINRQIINHDFRQLRAQIVAHNTNWQIKLTPQQAGSLRYTLTRRQHLPVSRQLLHVALQKLTRNTGRCRTHHNTHAGRTHTLANHVQALALLLIGNLTRNTHIIRLRQQYNIASGQGYFAGSSRTLGTACILRNLHYQALAFGNILFAAQIQKGILFQANINKGCLNATDYIADLALEHTSYQMLLFLALYQIFHQYSVFQQPHTGFVFVGAYNYFSYHRYSPLLNNHDIIL